MSEPTTPSPTNVGKVDPNVQQKLQQLRVQAQNLTFQAGKLTFQQTQLQEKIQQHCKQIEKLEEEAQSLIASEGTRLEIPIGVSWSIDNDGNAIALM